MKKSRDAAGIALPTKEKKKKIRSAFACGLFISYLFTISQLCSIATILFQSQLV